MQLITKPHEFLVRWGRDGRLQGHHVVSVTQACDEDGNPILKENGEVELERFNEAQPLSRAGITLDEIMDSLMQATLKDNTAKADEIEALQQAQTNLQEDVSTLQKKLEASEAARQELMVQVDRLNGILAALSGAPATQAAPEA